MHQEKAFPIEVLRVSANLMKEFIIEKYIKLS